MAGISSKASQFGNTQNKFIYNGKEEQRQEFSDGSSLDWLDYGASMYDNQIGRWVGIDKLVNVYVSYTPYNYVLNNPISNFDPNGKWTVSRHHRLTEDALFKFGIKYSDEAHWLSNYASVYADNPGNALSANNLVHANNRVYYEYDIDYSNTIHSQDRHWDPQKSTGYNFNIWHSMMSPEEHSFGSITEEEAMLKGMNFGWNMVIGAAKEGVKLKNLKKILPLFKN